MSITLGRTRFRTPATATKTNDRRHPICVRLGGGMSWYLSTTDAIDLANQIADAVEAQPTHAEQNGTTE